MRTTIGILLCKRKKLAIVGHTLPADANIHARGFNLYLSSRELLAGAGSCIWRWKGYVSALILSVFRV
ncbi:MAG: hypothetical protein M0T70_17470 [Geobacteraceae bacterium]|nr:hypothetical protein [Geobacteraceae bacterium]